MAVLFKALGFVVALFGLVCAIRAASVRVDGASVLVNEMPVLRFRATTGGVTPQMRATNFARAVAALPGTGAIVARRESVFAGKQLLLVVSPQEAALQGKPSRKVAAEWAQNLRRALTLPPLKAGVDGAVRLPVGSVKFVPIVGSEAAVAEVTSTALGVVSAERAPGGVRLRGLSPGKASIRVEAAGLLLPIDVDVKPHAAVFPQTVGSWVTGAPATAGTVRGSVEGALRTQLATVKGAKLTFDLRRAYSLNSGKTQTYQVKVWATGPESYESAGTVNVVVRNAALPRANETELWYSNQPERVLRPGPLFSARLAARKTARLLYHHVNDASQPMFFRIQAVNDSDTPARVVLIPGESDPDRNPVRAGMSAANQFVKNWLPGSAEVITIPPRSTLPLSLRRVSPGETVSGLCSIGLLDGPGHLLVRSDAWPPFPLERKWQNAIVTSAPWREVGSVPINAFDRAPFEVSTQIFPNPFKTEEVQYEVGGRYGFVRIGQRPISSHDQTAALDGNFGVIYNIKARVQNPTDEITNVEVVFEASAGYTGGLFVLNGKLLQTPLLQPKEESRIMFFRMDPGTKRSFDLMTLPVSGCSYPATITIRPASGSATSSQGRR